MCKGKNNNCIGITCALFDYDFTNKCIKKENANSGYPLLDKVRELQGYEPDYGETMTTQSEGRWIEKEAVLKILSKYFA